MKAAVLKGPRRLVVEEVPEPKPGRHQVLIQIKYCGICGSDLHYYESKFVPPGSIMGHEWAGIVVELGAGVTQWAVGDRVWPGVMHSPGWVWKKEYGWDRASLSRDSPVKDMGGYGQFAAYHEETLVRIPDEVTDLDACMADQAATSLSGLRAAKVKIGESVLVIGAGPIGLWALRLAQIAGARVVCVAEKIEGRAKIAEKMGADLVVNPSLGDVRPKVADFLDGVGADAVVECGGTESAFQLAIDLARPGGRIGAIGLSNDAFSIQTWNLVLKGLEVTGVVELDFPAGMEIIRQKKVECRDFLTEIIPLEQAPEAFETLLHPTDQEKIVIGY